MKVIADICLIPIGVGVSLSRYVKMAYDELVQSGLKVQLHPFGTIVEGEYADVSRAIENAMQAVHDGGAPRINLTIKMGSRLDKDQSMEDKIKAVKSEG